MSHLNHENNQDFKYPVPLSSDLNPKIQVQDQEEENSKDQLILPKEGFCPPKLDSSVFLSDNQTKSEKPVQQNSGSHAEKFNGPLEKPKTANKAFGGISDFLLFFENRNPEIKEFSKKFQEMEDMTKKNSALSLKILNEEIAPSIYESFIKMKVEFRNHESSKPVAQEDRSMKNLIKVMSKFWKKKIPKEQKPEKEYAQLFEKEFPNLEELYKQILHAYTIPGFLYLRMNEYLRTENWIKLDDLLIYTYCLFKAYLWGPTGLTDADSFAYLKSKSENCKLTLYRRADFDQVSLDFYCLDKIKVFSWTGVTSTSLLESATQKFAGKKPDRKPVLIVIEVDFQDLQPENFNALYLAKLSRCPEEEEVALAPGSIFELLDINKEKSEVEMRLKLVTDAKVLAHQGKFLHGMLQSVMRNGDDLKFVCLKEKELSRAIKHCQGNQLAKKLEFFLCNFNELSAQVFLDVLPTMKNLVSLTLSSILLEEYLVPILKSLRNTKITHLEIENPITASKNDFGILLECFEDFDSLENFKLSLREISIIKGSTIRTLYNLASHYLGPKCVFEFNLMNFYQIVVKDLKRSNSKRNLASFFWQVHQDFEEDLIEEYLREFPSKDKLQNAENQQQEIDLEKSQSDGTVSIEDGEIESHKISNQAQMGQTVRFLLRKGLFGYSFERNSHSLKQTLLEVLKERYTLTSEEGQKNEVLAFTEKQPLKELSLSFEKCMTIHHRNLKSLGCKGIQHIESLTTLKLNFDFCTDRNSSRRSGITDKALKILSNKVIRQLKGLVVLSLSFDSCSNITDKGLKKLACVGIQHLQLLTTLDLNLRRCEKITDQGLLSLSLEGIGKIKCLANLHLNFSDCHEITDKGFENLFQDGGGIQNLKVLSSLSLNFGHCKQITDEGLKVLSQKGLRDLQKSLKILSLNFDKCKQITNEGLRILNCEGVSHLELLTKLDLSFSHRKSFLKITDQGIKIFAQNLSALTTLQLKFDQCSEITDEGFRSLCLSKELTTLHLSFKDCSNITDFGLEGLSQKIKHLGSLEDLQLNFSRCKGMTDTGFSLLCSQGIKHLQKLNTLHLSFETPWEENPSQKKSLGITDKGLKSLGSDGIHHLPELMKLHLNFDYCYNITDEGVEFLSRNGIQHLKKLTDLRLSFQGCQGITNEGLQILSWQGILYLKESLNTLSLNFSSCDELSGVGLRSLCWEGIRSLNKLKDLSLKFYSCAKITTDGMEEFIDEGVRYLPFLATLNLHISGDLITAEQLLSIRYRMNLLNLPQVNNAKEDSRESYFSVSPNAASVFCQTSLGFRSQSNPHLLEGKTPKITRNNVKTIEGLTLKFLHEFGMEMTDLDVFRSIFNLKTLKDLKTLHLTLDKCRAITDFTLHNLCFECLKYFESLNTLNLSFNKCREITDIGLQTLGSQGLKHLKKLRNLSLSFDDCSLLTDKGLEILKEIQHPELFDSLNLSFYGCENLSDKGLISLCRTGIQHLKALTSLSLSFDLCEKITNKGIRKLYDYGLKHLEFLKSLYLSFHLCQKITKKGLKNLRHIYAQRLTSFYLNLGGVPITEKLKNQLLQSSTDSFILIRRLESESKEKAGKIAASRLRRQNVGVQKDFDETKPDDKVSGEIVANEMFTRYLGRGQYVLSAQYLGFQQRFFNSDETADETFAIAKKDIIALLLLSNHKIFQLEVEKLINKLYAQELMSFQSLTSLHLILEGWGEFITDSDLNVLCLMIFQHLSSLTTLHLSLDRCSKISNEGLKNLGSEGIRHLRCLTTLHLSFGRLASVTDVGLKNLCSEGVQHLKFLANLHLDFKNCDEITDIGFESLWNDGIVHLKSLTTLELSFEECRNITGVCLKNIKSEEAEDLKFLTRLHLNFDRCLGFKDEGFEHLCLGVIRSFTNLSKLHLNFDGCEGITDSGFQYLNFINQEFLTALYLSFDRCLGITEKGIQSLRLGSLKLLRTLHLRLNRCSHLIYPAFKSLLSLEISRFKSLQILDLSFGGSRHAVTDQLLEDLRIGDLSLLNALYLCFDICQKITGKGLKVLCCRQIQPLKLLRTLYLSFLHCKGLTEKCLESLFHDGIKHLNLLSNIHLCFTACEEILETQLPFLQDEINSLPLPHLQRPLQISNGTIFSESGFHQKSFLDSIISIHQESKRLELELLDDTLNETDQIPCLLESFNSSQKTKIEVIPDKLKERRCLDDISSQSENRFHLAHLDFRKNLFPCRDAIKNLEDLETLHITLGDSMFLENCHFKNLCCEIPQHFRSLKNLEIAFEGYDLRFDRLKIISYGIQRLEKLNKLQLSFDSSSYMSDQGLETLLNGMNYLKELKTLSLSFDQCNLVTDEGLKTLALKGTLNLSSLENLEFSFSNCQHITYSSYQAFIKILGYFGYFEVNQSCKKTKT